MRIAFVSGFALCLGIVGSALEVQLPRSDAKLSLDDHTSRVDVVAFSPDGTMAATGSSPFVEIWSTQSGKKLSSIRALDRGFFTSVLFLPDNKRVVVAGSRGKYVTTWKTDTREVDTAISTDDDGVTCLAMTNDGKLLAAATYSNAIHLIDLKTKKTIEVLKGHKSERQGVRTNSLAFSPDGKYLASAAVLDATVIWDIQKKKVVHTFVGDRSAGFNHVAWSIDVKTLATIGLGGIVILWDPKSGDFISKFDSTVGYSQAFAFSPKDDVLAIAGGSGKAARVVFWDMPTREFIGTRQGHTNSITSLAFSPDGKLLITGSHDKTAKIWQVPRK